MTNPNNAIGTNGAYGGRTSVDAFNDDLALFTDRGVLSGFAVSPDSGMTVVVGGNGTDRDVAVALDNIGNKTSINNISGSPIQVTIDGAPASNSRIDTIVAYVDNPPQGTATGVDNPSACGLIAVKGTVAPTPSIPTDGMIRTAITADGASGTTAYYVRLANITVANGTTDITGNMISQAPKAHISSDAIANGTITSGKLASSAVTTSKINNGAVTYNKIDWSTILTYESTFTSDSGGFIEIPYSVVNPTNGFILAIALTGTPGDNNNGLLTYNYCNRANPSYPNGLYAYKCMFWDGSAHTSTTLPIKVWYIKTS